MSRLHTTLQWPMWTEQMPTHHQEHISAENREPRTRGSPYWEVGSHETRGSTLSSWPSEGCSESGLWDYPHARMEQFLSCLKHRFPTWNTGVAILLDQWWVAGCIQTVDLGRNSQISPNSLWGLHESQLSPIKTTVLRAVLTCQSFQESNKACSFGKTGIYRLKKRHKTLPWTTFQGALCSFLPPSYDFSFYLSGFPHFRFFSAF